MAGRKPPGMTPEEWAEHQIAEGTRRGAFEGLAGAGKPIADLDKPFTAERWAVDWVRREGGDVGAFLPPLLALRRERAALLAELGGVPTESMVRELVRDFDKRLLDQYRRPMDGPLVAVGVLDEEETVARWRELHATMPAPVAEAPEPASGDPRTGDPRTGGSRTGDSRASSRSRRRRRWRIFRRS